MAFNLSIDVLRFSQALTPLGPAKIEWTHTSGTRLQVVLEGSDSHFSNAMLRMDVFQGTTLLERVNVADYIDASNRIRDAKIRAEAALRIEDLDIFGITKDPTLALRYQLDGNIRRLQMRMKTSQDFQQIVSILAKRGMEFSQQRPNTARPDTPSSRPSTMQHDGRTLTTRNVQAVHQEQTSARFKPSTFELSDLEAGCLSQPAIVNAPPSSHRSGQLSAPLQGSPVWPSSVQHWQSQPSQSTRSDEYEVQRRLNAHASVSLDQSNIDPEISRYAAEAFFQFSAAGQGVGHRGSKPPERKGWSSGGIPSRNSAISSDLSDARPSTALSVISATSTFPDTLEHEIPPERVLPFKATGNSRPSSAVQIPAAASLAMSGTLEHEIPPRRELPFKLPDRSSGNGCTSRPGSALPPPSSQKAKVSKERPKSASSVVKLTGGVNGCWSRQKDALEPVKITKLPVQSSLSFAASNSAPPEPEKNAEETVAMKDLIFGSSRLPRMTSTMDAPHELESPPISPSRHHSAIPQAAHVGASAQAVSVKHNLSTGNYGGLIFATDVSNELTLDQYTSQTPEARQTALDQFMINNLQNPSFTTLCEDTERCWRRIALGL